MKINFTEIAWDDYTYWQSQDKKTLKRINKLLRDIIATIIREWENLKH